MGASLLLFSWLPTSPKGIINELQLKAPCCLWNGPWQTNYMSTPQLHTFVSSPFPPRSVWWNIHLPTERYFLHLSNCFKKDRLKLISHRHFSGGVPSFSQWVTYGVGAMEFIPAHLSWLSLCSASPLPTCTLPCVLTDQHTQATTHLEPGFLFTFPESSTGFSLRQKAVAAFGRSLI